MRVKVGAPDVRISADGKTISIAIDVQEGDLHKFGKIDFKGDIIFGEEELRSKLKSKPGDTFKASLFQGDVTTLTDLYQDKGYAFVDVAPLTLINDADKTVDVTFDIAKGSEVYFNRINIVGNVRTKDKVVRRELKFAEGDLYSATNMKLTKRRLRNTTFFKEEELKTIKTDEPDKVNVDVIVDEKPTGTLSLGVGYSTYEKIITTGSVSQENIFGTGDKVYLSASLSSIMRLYNLTFVDPYTFDKNFTTSYNIFNTTQIFSDYDWKGSGGGVTVSRPFTEYIRGALGYRLQKMDIYNISSDAGPLIASQAGSSSNERRLRVYHQEHYRRRPQPDQGLDRDRPGRGRGRPLRRAERVCQGGRFLWPVHPLQVGHHILSEGHGREYDALRGDDDPDLRAVLRGRHPFNAGVRVWRRGPLDPSTGDPVGSTKEVYFNNEWIFPVYKPAGLKGFVFLDYGKGFNNTFFQPLRPAAGFGMRWFSPMGPITVELGLNLNRKSGEKGDVFDFSMGKPF